MELAVTQEAKVYSISVDPKELTFESERGEKEITIASSDNWSLRYAPGWITLSEEEGENGDTYKYVDIDPDGAKYVNVTFESTSMSDSEATISYGFMYEGVWQGNDYEYNVDIISTPLPYQYIRWIKNKDVDFKKLNLSSDTKKVQDLKGQYLLLFSNEWGVRWATDKNPDLALAEFSQN